MKNFTRTRGFLLTPLVAASLCPVLSACSSMNMEDIAPQQQAASPSAAAQTSQAAGSGDYPNLNIPVQPAAEQLSTEERQRLIDELSAKRGVAAGPNPASLSEAERLRRLARQRQEETLSAIESAQ